jgi:hypothetical protein
MPLVTATDDTAREAAAMLRRVLDAVERGDLDAGSGRATALVRKIEGAAAALEAVGGARADHGEGDRTPCV